MCPRAKKKCKPRSTRRLEARTGYLAMLGNAAMLAGLLGTVAGLIRCFEAVATVNPADKATILAEGISEAMNCTGFGLFTAIPSLIAFSVLMGRTQHLINDINETSVSVLNLIVSNRDKFKNVSEAARHDHQPRSVHRFDGGDDQLFDHDRRLDPDRPPPSIRRRRALR